jgi:hypothetical protein
MPVRSYGTLSANTVATATVNTSDYTQALPVSIGFPETVNDAPFAKPVHRVNKKIRMIEVISFGAGDIFFTVDGTNPTVNGADTFVCTAESSVVVQVSPANSASVKLICSSPVAYGVSAR